MVTIAELRKRCQVEHDKSPYKAVSVYFTYAAIKMRLTPDAVTVMELISVITGSILIMTNTLSMIWIIGGILFVLGDIFDKVNGELARYYGKQSWKGALIDGLADTFKLNTIIVAMSIGLFKTLANTATILLGFTSLVALNIYHFAEKNVYHIYNKNNLLAPMKSYDDVAFRSRISGIKGLGLTLISAFYRNMMLLTCICLDALIKPLIPIIHTKVLGISLSFTLLWLSLYTLMFTVGSLIRVQECIKAIERLDLNANPK